MGTLERLTVADVEPQLRAAVAAAVATHLGRATVPFAELGGDQIGLSQQLRQSVQPAFDALGLQCTAFFVESLSLPDSAGGADGASEPRHQGEDADDSPYRLIEKLHDLFIAGALSKEEYAAKKAQLLARIH
jgi:hypothetical protein